MNRDPSLPLSIGQANARQAGDKAPSPEPSPATRQRRKIDCGNSDGPERRKRNAAAGAAPPRDNQ